MVYFIGVSSYLKQYNIPKDTFILTSMTKAIIIIVENVM